MSTSTRTQPFLSLYWKATSGLALILLTLITFFTYFNAQQLATLQTHHRYLNQQQYLVQYNGLLEKSAIQLSNLLDSFPYLGAENDTLPKRLQSHWLTLQITWGLESATLFDEHGTFIKSWGEQHLRPGKNAMNHARLRGTPARELICDQYCKLAVTSPVLDKDGTLYITQVSVSLADTMLDFQRITGSDIGLITPSSTVSVEDNALGETGLSISALTNRATMQPILFALAKREGWQSDFGFDKRQSNDIFIVDTRFAQHEVMFLSSPELASNNARIVVLSDTTTAREQIGRARNTYIASGILATLLSLGLVIFAIWQPIVSLQRQSKALPLLPQGKFEEARKRLQHLARNRFFADELSQLQSTSIKVTRQLEDYQKQLLSNSKKLYDMAHYDTLTGLFNRAYMTELIDTKLHSDDQADSSFALIYLDLDNFKHINDALGHNIGDQLLIIVAKRLKNCIDNDDYAARLGGDEFCLVSMRTSEAEGAAAIAKRVLRSLEEPVVIDGRNLAISSSIGITLAPIDGNTAASLLQHADLAMYKAKSEGKNNYHIFSEELHKDADTRIALEAELRRAVQENEFELHYQPQIKLDTGELIGCEALIRWQHPERGLLAPFFFIDTIENNGLIIPVGKWILEEACRQCAEWNAQGLEGIKMSINLSARQFSDPELLSDIKQAIAKAGIEPSSLELEVTESLLATDIKHAISILKELQSLGLTIAIDDFGTGYSSLSYLKQLPLDKLKIDRAFVKDIPEDNDDKQITSAIVAMAHSLNLRVVAEGVETQEQEDYLRDLNCEIGQGYLFNKPLSPQDFLNSELTKTAIQARHQKPGK